MSILLLLWIAILSIPLAALCGFLFGRHYAVISYDQLRRSTLKARLPDIVDNVQQRPKARIISPLQRKRAADLARDLNA